jgi:hypothetical protein
MNNAFFSLSKIAHSSPAALLLFLLLLGGCHHRPGAGEMVPCPSPEGNGKTIAVERKMSEFLILFSYKSAQEIGKKSVKNLRSKLKRKKLSNLKNVYEK